MHSIVTFRTPEMQNIQIGLWTFVNTVDSGTERKSKEGVDFFRLRCLCTFHQWSEQVRKNEITHLCICFAIIQALPFVPWKAQRKKKQTNEKNIFRDVRVANENNNF